MDATTLRQTREAAADAALAAFDFDPFVITETSSHWRHESITEADGDRVFTVVSSNDPATDDPLRAQFNVFFAPGTAHVAHAYVGDWSPV